jgi:GMP synthase (glutamine-hydrolysing)
VGVICINNHVKPFLLLVFAIIARMKTLIIDNGSTLIERLVTLSPGNEEVVDYDNIPEDLSVYSLIILSGSSKFPVHGSEDIFKAETELIKNTNVPIVGICFGHELIAHAFGAEVVHLGMQHKGLCEVKVTQPHEIFGGKDSFLVYENHQYGISTVPNSMEVLAESTNSIAVVKHKERPIYGFQFHPEHMPDQQFGDEVFLNLFSLLT